MDPRIERTRRAVLDAATALLVEGGPSSMTMDAVVARSGVAKSTVYRHWANRDELVASVFTTCVPELEVPADDVPFEDAIRLTVRSLGRSLADDRWRELIPSLLLLSRQHAQLAEIDTDLKKDQQELAETILRRGVDEGALRPEVLDDTERTIWLLVGPLLIASLSRPLDAVTLSGLAEATVDQFLAGNRPA